MKNVSIGYEQIDAYMSELYERLTEMLPNNTVNCFMDKETHYVKLDIHVGKYKLEIDPVKSIVKNGYMLPVEEFAKTIVEGVISIFQKSQSPGDILEGQKAIVRLIPEKYAPVNDMIRCRLAEGIDIAVYLQLSDTNNTATYTPVTKSMFSGLDDLESFSNFISLGIKTTSELYPPVIMEFNPSDDIFGISEISVDDWCEKPISKAGGMHTICLTNKSRTNGAVTVCYPEVLKKIASKLNSDLYLVFTSVHEVMIHSVNDLLNMGFACSDLVTILSETMDEATPETDVLTHDIYKYDRDTGIVAKVVFNDDQE